MNPTSYAKTTLLIVLAMPVIEEIIIDAKTIYAKIEIGIYRVIHNVTQIDYFLCHTIDISNFVVDLPFGSIGHII